MVARESSLFASKFDSVVFAFCTTHLLFILVEVSAKPKEKKEAPGKLLDDLFRKTKALPCIYWLPLSKEQVTCIAHYAYNDSYIIGLYFQFYL